MKDSIKKKISLLGAWSACLKHLEILFLGDFVMKYFSQIMEQGVRLAILYKGA